MKRLQTQSGFTLTELLISVIIIAIGVVGFATAVGLASTELFMGRRDTEVSLLLTEQAEQLKAMPYDSVLTDSRTEGPYTVNWDVQNGNPKEVTISVTFSLKDGRTRADTIVIYVLR
jgi:prepilin-type N-terminal cleavage/methylation domain-containing protein